MTGSSTSRRRPVLSGLSPPSHCLRRSSSTHGAAREILTRPLSASRSRRSPRSTEAASVFPDVSAARVAYRQATPRSPYTPAFWWNLGRMELEFAKQNEAGARDAAYEAMRRAIATDPQNPDTFDRFARMQLALGDYRGAIESEQQAIAFFPTIPGYYTVAAAAARQLRATDSAAAILRKGIAATDSNDLRIALARRLIEATRLPEARQILRDVLTKEPANAAALDLQKQIGAQ